MSSDEPTMPSRHAFTLLELVVVIAIILVLAGLSMAAVGSIRRSQQAAASRTLVQTVAAAIEAYGIDTLQPPAASGVASQRPLFDVDLDFRIDPRPTSLPALQTLSPAWYLGFADTLGGQLPAWALTADGTVQDRWRQPLRIDRPGWRSDAQKDAASVGAARGTDARLYGSAKVGIWSTGPDGVDGPPGSAVEADNLRSW
jgi:prepilin-type N-terminal cleavage/methylation domain-containing protein